MGDLTPQKMKNPNNGGVNGPARNLTSDLLTLDIIFSNTVDRHTADGLRRAISWLESIKTFDGIQHVKETYAGSTSLIDSETRRILGILIREFARHPDLIEQLFATENGLNSNRRKFLEKYGTFEAFKGHIPPYVSGTIIPEELVDYVEGIDDFFLPTDSRHLVSPYKEINGYMDTLRKTTMARQNIDRAMYSIESPGYTSFFEYGGSGSGNCNDSNKKNSRTNIKHRSSKYRKKGSRKNGSRKMRNYRKKNKGSRRKRFVQK